MDFAIIDCMIFGFNFQLSIGVNILVIAVVVNKPHTIVSRRLIVISETIIRTNTLIIVK